MLDRGIQGEWALLDDGICVLDVTSTPPVIEFFSFATQRLSQIAAISREVMPRGPATSLAVSPDGRWLLYTQYDRIESEIMLMENFR